jgi:hypothetical protein
MTNKLHCISWDGKVVVQVINGNYDTFAGCCGARYYNKFKTNENGIALLLGKHEDLKLAKNDKLVHIATKNGDITFVLAMPPEKNNANSL